MVFMFATSLRPASRWATRDYLNPSAGFAGDDRGRGMHSIFFMVVQNVRNGNYTALLYFLASVFLCLGS